MRNQNRLKPEWASTPGYWLYLSCHTFVKFPNRGGVTITGPECDGCGNKNVRYFHTLEHEETGQQISVRIECARMLLGISAWEIPRLGENKVKRKERWRVHYRKPGRCIVTEDDLIEMGKL